MPCSTLTLSGHFAPAELSLSQRALTMRTTSLPQPIFHVAPPTALMVACRATERALFMDALYELPFELQAPPVPLLCSEVRVTTLAGDVVPVALDALDAPVAPAR